MEAFLAVLMVLGIFVLIPVTIGFIIVAIASGLFKEIRDEVTGEVRKLTMGLALVKHRGVQLAILVLLFLYYPLIYYSGELIDHFGWEALRWDFFYTVHDIHRIVFMIPIIYAAYCFKIKGAIITSILAFAMFLPRALLLSPYPDPISRMVLFTVFACVLGILVGVLRNQIERLQHLVVATEK